MTFENAQKIFGYIDKSSYIDLLEIILIGDEEKIINHYRNLYNSGVEPSIFLNEFLEILYLVKNISYIENEGTNFSLNDNDYKKLKLAKFKLCLVSPELNKTNKFDIDEIKDIIKEKSFQFDAVCTKFPEKWDSDY